MGLFEALDTYRSVSPLSLLLVLRPPLLLLQVLLPVAAAPTPAAAVPLRFGRFHRLLRRRRPELLVRGVLEVVRVSVVAAEPAAGEEVGVVALERKEESVVLKKIKEIKERMGFFKIYLTASMMIRVPVVVPVVGAVVVFLLDLWCLWDRPVRVDVVVNQAGELARVRPPVVQGPWGRNEMLSYYMGNCTLCRAKNPARSLELCEDLAGEGAVRVVDEPGVDPALLLLRRLRHRLVLGQVRLRKIAIESRFFQLQKSFILYRISRERPWHRRQDVPLLLLLLLSPVPAHRRG